MRADVMKIPGCGTQRDEGRLSRDLSQVGCDLLTRMASVLHGWLVNSRQDSHVTVKSGVLAFKPSEPGKRFKNVEVVLRSFSFRLDNKVPSPQGLCYRAPLSPSNGRE